MRVAITVRVVGAVACVLGCKDKPQNQPVAPQPVIAVADAAVKSGSGAGTEVVLPTRTGTPPVKSTKPLTQQRAKELSTLDYAGFKKDIRNLDDKGLDIRYQTDTRPIIAITLTVQPCFKCEPMELDKWQKHREALRELLAPDLRSRPDTVFELGKTELLGTPMIWQYQVGYFKGQDPGGFAMTAYSNAYALYYNDTVNMIRVVAEYKDDPPASRDDLLRLVPREDLERTALAFLDVYTHEW